MYERLGQKYIGDTKESEEIYKVKFLYERLLHVLLCQLRKPVKKGIVSLSVL
jgi:hypothetical protein